MTDPTGDPHNGLITQGTVDWTSMGQSALGFGGSVLQRLANADIQPSTLTAAYHISSLFQLSDSGRRLVQEAVSTLPCCAGLGNALYFGFGLKHPVRSLGEQDRGQRILALCSCLASVLSISNCADVLYALAQASCIPDEFRPSPQQWVNLLNACGGVLRTTKFSTVAGHFMSLSPDKGMEGKFAAHKAVADALLALFRVSCGQDVSVSVAGGRFCGWMAAFGKEILGLEVQIQDDKGSLLYQSTDVEQDIKLSVCYQEDSSSASCIVSNRSYFIESLSDIFYFGDEGLAESVISGTVEWGRCLSSMAGDDFQQTLGPDSNFARIISLAARIFEGVSKREGNSYLEPSLYEPWPAYHPRQYGSGFIRSAAEWFPELAYLKEAPYHARGMSIDDALDEMAQFMCTLQESGLGETGYTLVHRFYLTLTVLFLTWNLSFLRIDKRFEPYEKGLKWAYEYVKRWLEQQIEFIRQPPNLTRQDVKGVVEALPGLLKMGSVYYTAHQLFNLDTVRHYEQAFVAISTGGLCFYFDILGRVSDKVEDTTILHVLPGSIETPAGRTFTTVTNLTGSGDVGCMWLREMDFDGMYNSPSDGYPVFHKSYTTPQPVELASFQGRWRELGKDTGTQGLKVHLIIEESTKGLRADLCFRSAQGECRVGVYTMLCELIISTGRVPYCDHEGTSRNISSLSPGLVERAFVVDSEGNIQGFTQVGWNYIIRLSGNKLARCIGLLIKKPRGPDKVTILRRAECVACCLDAASQAVEDVGTPVGYIIL